MIENPVADAWRIAVKEMELPFASPFVFIDNRGRERQCTGLLPHVGAPRGTLISTKYDPDFETFIASVRGLDYYPVILTSPLFEKYDEVRFVTAVRDWGWYGPDKLRPPFFDEYVPPGEEPKAADGEPKP